MTILNFSNTRHQLPFSKVPVGQPFSSHTFGVCEKVSEDEMHSKWIQHDRKGNARTLISGKYVTIPPDAVVTTITKMDEFRIDNGAF